MFSIDIVIWDSHPLTLGSTPYQVYIDGIPQLSSSTNAPYPSKNNVYIPPKPAHLQRAPHVPNFDKEARDAVLFEGLPPFTSSVIGGNDEEKLVLLKGIKSVYLRKKMKSYFGESDAIGVEEAFNAQKHAEDATGIVLIKNGVIICIGSQEQDSCSQHIKINSLITTIEMHNGTITPSLTSFGSQLGLGEMGMVRETRDGVVFDIFDEFESESLGRKIGGMMVIKAADGLMFESRDALYVLVALFFLLSHSIQYYLSSLFTRNVD